MARRGRYVALALAATSLFTNAAEARRSPDETVLIRFRHSYAICAGVCPNFRIQVSPEGEVVTHSLRPGGQTYRFRASFLQLQAFRRILSGIRPAGERRLDARCEPVRSADGSPDPMDHPRPDDVEILWSSDDAQTRLTACGYSHTDMRFTLVRALYALGADSGTGDRVQPED